MGTSFTASPVRPKSFVDVHTWPLGRSTTIPTPQARMPPCQRIDGASVLATAVLATVAGCAAALSPSEVGREISGQHGLRREGSANGSDPFSDHDPWWIALVVLGAVVSARWGAKAILR